MRILGQENPVPFPPPPPPIPLPLPPLLLLLSGFPSLQGHFCLIILSLILFLLYLFYRHIKHNGGTEAAPPVADPPVADPPVADPPVADAAPPVADPPVADPPVADPPVLSITYGAGAVIPFDQIECPICLSDFENLEELIQISSCRHVFHRDCMDAYLRNLVSQEMEAAMGTATSTFTPTISLILWHVVFGIRVAQFSDSNL
ncbi:E3 ubiquitin-protein ligase RING1-like [Corylus avellana]|uniref:E3 ubiquitin-protein ligase RING1-like n=1 Tax=Corylus avellana TaxID=13451 RepID=UPI00286BCC7B|nr:E3 ubiquitin-protein ligase RING1-like [Corylus avellana]